MSHVSNGEEKSKVQGVAMCHNLIGVDQFVYRNQFFATVTQ